jgi:ABC-type phosphate/phosphonate transport system substrate-binding protein
MNRRSQPDTSGPRTALEIVEFAYAAHAASSATKRHMGDFLAVIGRLSGLDFGVAEADSYRKLARLVHERAVDVAWLPPIPYLALEQQQAVVPLVSHERGGSTQFHCVLIVGAESKIHHPVGLRGKRAAWVDPLSAAGYVIPRIHLAAMGVDPRSAFASEHFYGSHEAVVRAVVGGKADFGATYARGEVEGAKVRGAWSDLEGADEAVRVLCAFGAVPSDVIAARPDLAGNVRFRVARALMDASKDAQGKLLMGELFGVDDFKPWASASYDLLRSATRSAAAGGLLGGSTV